MKKEQQPTVRELMPAIKPQPSVLKNGSPSKKESGSPSQIAKIYYPRSMHISSASPTVDQVQTTLRKQRAFHKDFVPQLNRLDLQTFNDLIYKPNIVLTPKECTKHVNDYVLEK